MRDPLSYSAESSRALRRAHLARAAHCSFPAHRHGVAEVLKFVECGLRVGGQGAGVHTVAWGLPFCNSLQRGYGRDLIHFPVQFNMHSNATDMGFEGT